LRKKFPVRSRRRWPSPTSSRSCLALGISADFIAGDQQRDINARDIEAWKKVASDAKIEVK
jgi:hypothetical protein